MTLETMDIMGYAMYELNRHEEALGLSKEVLAICSRVLSLEDKMILRTMHRISTSLRALKRYDEELIMNEQILEIRVRRDGDEHPDSLSALCNVALVQMHCGQLDDALRSASGGRLLAKKVGHVELTGSFDNLLLGVDRVSFEISSKNCQAS
jgi:hypothetical protein